MKVKSRPWFGIRDLFLVLQYLARVGERERKPSIDIQKLPLTHCLGPNLVYLTNLFPTFLFIFSLRNYKE